MPNHVTTVCTVTGPAADVAAFVEKHIVPVPCDEHDDCKTSQELAIDCAKTNASMRNFDFNTIIPRPKVLDDTISPDRDHPQNRLAEKETGFSNWYDWAIANWSTKWGAYDFDERERGDGRYVFKFETAWSFPEKPFRKLAEMHPTLVFDVASHDEGDNFGCLGEFNGKNDYRCERDLGESKALYERVYGRKKPQYDDDGNEIEECTPDSESPRHD
jgi:hypothetical protein